MSKLTNENEIKNKILTFLKTQTLGVMATNNVEGGGAPESAIVAFSETDKLELIFGTFNNTRKYANLKKNLNISFVIGEGDVTVQYEGKAEEASGETLKKCRNIHVLKNPPSKKYAFDEQQRFFKVTPHWIRYSDLSSTPEEVFEIRF